jgi:hypothetical protein
MHRRRRGRAYLFSLVAALAVLASGGGVSAKSKKDPPPEDLARIYVLYTEPPFVYEKGEVVRIRLITLWDRDRKEREIREEVARHGADAVILERSFMEYDSVANTAAEPGPRGTRTMLKIPTRTAYVEGHLARRVEGSPCACERPYPVDFDRAWKGVNEAAAALGWRWGNVDTDSRSLTAHFVSATGALICEAGAAEAPPAVLTVWVRSYAKASVVRLDVAALAPATGPRPACRSGGTLETAFFEQLARHLN